MSFSFDPEKEKKIYIKHLLTPTYRYTLKARRKTYSTAWRVPTEALWNHKLLNIQFEQKKEPASLAIQLFIIELKFW